MLINKILFSLRWRLNHYFNKKSLQLAAWYRDDTQDLFKYKFNLSTDSIVIDLGGFKGEWTEKLIGFYDIKLICIYEPHPIYFSLLNAKFNNNDKVIVKPFGISKIDETIEIADIDNSSSTFKKSDKMLTANFISVNKAFVSFQQIDLIKINIEGGEYDLLEGLIKNNEIRKFKNILVQFHNFVPNADKRMKRIKKNLKVTHNLIFEYRYVWEKWELKNI